MIYMFMIQYIFCLDTVPIRFQALYEITVFENITHVLCYGDSTGSIILDSINGGNIPYDIQWGGVNNTALSAGTYFVQIVDSIGCLHTEEYIILQPDVVNPNEILYPPLCFGDTNGSIVIDITGGMGLLSYYWLNGLGNSDSLYALSDSVYSLIVIDSVACVDTFHFVLQSPLPLDLDLILSDSILFCGVPITIDVVISGGIYPYSIQWSDGDTNQQKIINSGDAGYYVILITDENNCFSTDSFMIIEPDPLDISIVHSNISCTEGATAIVNVTGGVPPYTYLWSNGDTTDTITDLSSGIYWVQVTDSCGSVYDTIYLDDYELNVVIYYDSLTHTAEAEIESTTSLGPFGYEWLDTLCSVAFQRFPAYDSISPFLCGGCQYFVVTTDFSNNCSVIDTIMVPIDNIPLSVIDLSTTTVDTVSLSTLWGTPPYNYLWNDTLWSTTHYGYPCPDEDSSWVEITDSNKCIISIKFFISEIIISLDPSDAILECDLENIDINLEASATGGTGIYSFLWWNGSTQNPINLGMSPGNFSVNRYRCKWM